MLIDMIDNDIEEQAGDAFGEGDDDAPGVTGDFGAGYREGEDNAEAGIDDLLRQNKMSEWMIE